MQSAAEKAQQEIAKFADQASNMYGRPLLKKTFECSLSCVENTSTTSEQLNGCIRHCQTHANEFEQGMNSEIEQISNRVQRCGMDCQDKARDEVTRRGVPREESSAVLQEIMSQCLVGCYSSVGKELIPAAKTRMDQKFGH